MTRAYALRLVSFAAIATAQSTGAAYAADAVDAAVDAAAVDDAAQDSTGLVDIVVTATKRETNLQDTPIAIAVMSDEDLKKRQVSSLIDLADGGIPSLRVATFESRQTALTVGMRGIVPGDANQPAREQGVGVYIDGVYLGRQHGLNAGFLDVQRIEVLKGPQGTLFGRNTEGGAVNIVTRAPTGEFGGKVTAGVGNFGSYSGQLRLDLPEIAGFSFKIDAGLQHQNATTKNPLEGQFGWNYFHRYGGRISARWEPTPTITADFSADLGRDENTSFLSQLINYNPENRPP
jgi:iron complex outermembrane recepter protein